MAVIREAYDRQTVCLSLAEHRNVLVFAFNHIDQAGTALAQADLDILERQWQVEFGQFYQQMLLDNPKGSGVL